MNKDNSDCERGVARKLTFVLACLLLPGGGREAFVEGVKLLRLGKASEAFDKFKEAEEAYGEAEAPVGLFADLALAAQLKGDAATAETYAERAAARDGSFVFLRDMLVGVARYEEARVAVKKGGAELERGLEKVDRAIASFEHALLERPDSAEALRNLERGLRLKRELEEKRKEGEEKKEDDEKDDEKEKKEEKKEEGKEEKKDQQQEKTEPQKTEAQKAEAQELSAEEKKRLMQKLEESQKKLRALKQQRRPRHKPGKKDW